LRAIRFAQRVEHHEVVEDALVSRRCDVGARVAELARVRLALVSQDIGLGGDNERSRQAGEVILGRAQRGGGDLRALGLVGGRSRRSPR
jgi:hypothetical protein